VTRSLAADLARSGVAVLSGLARGIDTAAHEGALDAGGRSGAVLGTGIERAYPRENAALQVRLRSSVGLLSEIAPGSSSRPGCFASRNRLLAALSDATIVVQGRERSGALLTAREARDLGRPVGAVPWDCRDPLGEAPHALIRAGEATLVRHVQDVLDLLGRGARAATSERELVPEEPGARGADLPRMESRLLAALRRRPLPLDVVAAAAGLSAAEAGAALVSLELLGLAWSEPGGLVRRVQSG
jgi:DNA processing protein